MTQQKIRRGTALLLSALILGLSACKEDEGRASDPSTAGVPPSVQQTVEPSETAPVQSAGPTGTSTPSPSPPPAASPTPSSPPESSGAPNGLIEAGESVTEEWFADAVFLGDSRTDGLRLYSGIKGASFISHQGLSVFTVGSNACINLDGSKVTAMEALAQQQWAKVYVMLGVNELGYDVGSFQQTYTKVVDQIKELQPDAAIYLQTLIPVNEPIAYKNGTSTAINNEKLKQFNDAIAQVAEDEGVALVDVDAPFWSEKGCLDPENTSDGVHLSRAGYVAWYEYLKTHTGEGLTFCPADPSAPETDGASTGSPAPETDSPSSGSPAPESGSPAPEADSSPAQPKDLGPDAGAPQGSASASAPAPSAPRTIEEILADGYYVMTPVLD